MNGGGGIGSRARGGRSEREGCRGRGGGREYLGCIGGCRGIARGLSGVVGRIPLLSWRIIKWGVKGENTPFRSKNSKMGC